jgi:hypothetical protein
VVAGQITDGLGRGASDGQCAGPLTRYRRALPGEQALELGRIRCPDHYAADRDPLDELVHRRVGQQPAGSDDDQLPKRLVRPDISIMLRR